MNCIAACRRHQRRSTAQYSTIEPFQILTSSSQPPLKPETMRQASEEEMHFVQPALPLSKIDSPKIDHSPSAMLNDTSPTPKREGIFSMFLIWALLGFLMPYCFPIALCIITKSMPNRTFSCAAFVGFCSGAAIVAGIFAIDWFVRGRPT